jgi:putative transposase
MLGAVRAKEVWSCDITYLPTNVRGIWLYLFLVIEVWSRKVVARDVDVREDQSIAGDLVSRSYLRADQQGPKAAADHVRR